MIVESRCRRARDVIPTAHDFIKELYRLWGDGYDVRTVTIKGTLLRNDQVLIPKSNLVLFGGDLVEKPRTAPDGR